MNENRSDKKVNRLYKQGNVLSGTLFNLTCVT